MQIASQIPEIVIVQTNPIYFYICFKWNYNSNYCNEKKYFIHYNYFNFLIIYYVSKIFPSNKKGLICLSRLLILYNDDHTLQIYSFWYSLILLQAWTCFLSWLLILLSVLWSLEKWLLIVLKNYFILFLWSMLILRLIFILI